MLGTDQDETVFHFICHAIAPPSLHMLSKSWIVLFPTKYSPLYGAGVSVFLTVSIIKLKNKGEKKKEEKIQAQPCVPKPQNFRKRVLFHSWNLQSLWLFPCFSKMWGYKNYFKCSLWLEAWVCFSQSGFTHLITDFSGSVKLDFLR